MVDKALLHNPSVGLHPDENTGTVFIATDDLMALLEKQGVKITYVEID